MKKIMFNDRYGLTKAVLEGRKTMTRRIITVQPANDDMMAHICYNEDKYIGWQFITAPPIGKVAKSEIFKPHYKVGEIVAVAQRYQDIFDYSNCVNPYAWEDDDKPSGWTNKMLTAAELMPHQIRITGIRCERLQDITEEDCIKEGIQFIEDIEKYYFERFDRDEGFYFDTSREAFASLIDKVSGRGTWQSNPYVWVYEFELLN